MREIKLFINGAHVAGTSGRTGDVYNPATGEVEAKVTFASDADLQAAVGSHRTALHDACHIHPRVIFLVQQYFTRKKKVFQENIIKKKMNLLIV